MGTAILDANVRRTLLFSTTTPATTTAIAIAITADILQPVEQAHDYSL